jgi:RimJ/RimL family protein N-acetyltransferase
MSVPRGVRVVVRRTGDRASEPPVRGVEAIRHPGESVHGAAVRALREAGLHGPPPWAVDVSRRVAILAVDVPDAVAVESLPNLGDGQAARALQVPAMTVAFRPMGPADLPDVVRWTTAAHVARWWDGEASDLERAQRRYGPRLAGEGSTRMWVFEVNGRSVGFAQDYLVGDHPEYALLTARPEAVGFDYVVGDPGWVGRGAGTRLLWEYLRDVVRPHYADARTFFAAPDHRNAPSLRVLDKLGFERGLWFDEPRSDGSASTVVGCAMPVPRILGRLREGRQVTGR